MNYQLLKEEAEKKVADDAARIQAESEKAKVRVSVCKMF
jgi:hypothetical protein